MPTSFTHELNAIKGSYGSPYSLDIVAPIKAGETLANYVSGSCVSLDKATSGAADRRLILGLPAPVSTNAAMPIFLFPNAKDFDVANNADGNINFAGVGLGGVVPNNANDGSGKVLAGNNGAPTGLVAVGNFELETTEFVASTYHPNDLLTAATTDGKLVLIATTGATVIAGVVSNPPRLNDFQLSVLRFWPVFIPRFS